MTVTNIKPHVVAAQGYDLNRSGFAGGSNS